MKEVLVIVSQIIVPLVMISIILYGLMMKTPIYTVFIRGATNGFTTVFNILPTLIGLMVAVGILRASGFLECIGGLLGTVTSKVGLPGELVPLGLVKMFSSSAATGLLLDLYSTYGVDSPIGLAGSIMMSSTETIFYTVSIYFMSVNVTKSRWTIPGAILCSLTGIIVSVLIAMG